MRWSKLGCVGPDGSSLEPFFKKRGKYLDPEGAAAKRFLRLFAVKKKGGLEKAKASKYDALLTSIDAVIQDPTGTFAKLDKEDLRHEDSRARGDERSCSGV